jgi:hypothetical protein
MESTNQAHLLVLNWLNIITQYCLIVVNRTIDRMTRFTLVHRIHSPVRELSGRTESDVTDLLLV